MKGTTSLPRVIVEALIAHDGHEVGERYTVALQFVEGLVAAGTVTRIGRSPTRSHKAGAPSRPLHTRNPDWNSLFTTVRHTHPKGKRR